MASGLLDFLFGQKVLRDQAGATPVDHNYTPAGQQQVYQNALYAAKKLQTAPANIPDFAKYPVIKGAGGQLMPRTMVVPDGKGGGTVIPIIAPNGQVLSQQDAVANFHKTGKHLGSFKNMDAANAYAQSIQ